MRQENGIGVCPHCGTRLSVGAPCYTMDPQQAPAAGKDDSDSIGWGVLGFFFPVVGFILWLVWQDECPRKAKRCGKGALISLIVGAAITVITVVIAVIVASAIAGAAIGSATEGSASAALASLPIFM